MVNSTDISNKTKNAKLDYKFLWSNKCSLLLETKGIMLVDNLWESLCWWHWKVQNQVHQKGVDPKMGEGIRKTSILNDTHLLTWWITFWKVANKPAKLQLVTLSNFQKEFSIVSFLQTLGCVLDPFFGEVGLWTHLKRLWPPEWRTANIRLTLFSFLMVLLGWWVRKFRGQMV